MSKKGKPASEDSITKDILAWRKDILKLAVMAIPSLLVTLGTAWLKEKLFAQPWQAIWVLLPLSLFVGVIWARIKKGGSLLFSKPFRWLLFGYVTIFSVAASSRFLDFQIRPVGYNHAVPRNWLSLNWAGDWRYWIARRKSVDPKLLVVTMARPEGRTLEDIRLDCIRLLKLATLQEAKGFAMDFYFDKGSQLDSLFCLTVAQARARKIEISLGYNIVAIENDFQRTFIAASLQNCFPLEAQGHLIGLAERDGKVRVMPLFFKGDRTLPSLSYKFASSILAKAGQTLLPPRSGLVQFVAPQEEIARVSYEKLIDDRERWPLLRDRFVLVGELSERDAFSTAFGKLPGVVIHAYAA
ncbi:MAG TPA: CHASE2 domain-containing protein, partial [bacterium]